MPRQRILATLAGTLQHSQRGVGTAAVGNPDGGVDAVPAEATDRYLAALDLLGVPQLRGPGR